MTSYTSPKTYTATTLTAAELNTYQRDNISNLNERLTVSGITSPSALNKVKSARCGVVLDASADTTASDSSDKTLLWDSEVWDTDSFHSTSSNTHRITIPSGLDGTYLFTANIGFESNTTGDRRVWVEDSTGTIRGEVNTRAATNIRTDVSLSFVYSCSAGDWFAVHVYQDSGGSRTIYQDLSRYVFSAVRLFAA